MSIWRDGLAGKTRVSLTVDGAPVVAEETDTVATLLFRLGYTSFGNNPVTGAPRAPTCMMGVCFGCLCEIDGRPESQACLEIVREGMVVVTVGRAASEGDSVSGPEGVSTSSTVSMSGRAS